MKNVLILGATGTAGCALTKKLLNDTDCHLTLFSRHAEDMYTNTERTTVVNGDAENIEELRNIISGHDVVYCAISGNELPLIAQNIVTTMSECHIQRLIFMGAVGIYNEIPDEIDGDDNLDNEPAQIPNRKAVDVVESSDLNYTILRPRYLGAGDENVFVLTLKGESAKGYTTSIPALVKFALKLILNNTLYENESVSITHDATKTIISITHSH